MLQRLSSKEIKKIGLLARKGKSLNQICNILGKSKTTVYYHFRKAKGKTTNPIILRSNNEELIGEFIGLFAGDGYANTTVNYQYRTYLFFNLKKEELFVENLIKNVLIPLFGKSPGIIKSKSNLNLLYYSKEIHNLINNYLIWNKKFKKTYTIKLKSRDHPEGFVKGFIRGSIDSDGYISKKKICFATVSEGLAKDIHSMLNKLNIKNSLTLYKEKRPNRKDIYHIFVSRYDHKKFLTLINPRNR